ncbi:MAG: cold shock domain-containing protein [Actinobacteria bacterium]|nr:cold shock domain-containing protein [Actinomycetota bacterium]
MKGTVKWFNREKGYGFIHTEDDRDVFVHQTAIETPGFRSLEEGEEVELDVEPSDKGPRAVHVKKLRESA